jgi:hypothetical protein
MMLEQEDRMPAFREDIGARQTTESAADHYDIVLVLNAF